MAITMSKEIVLFCGFAMQNVIDEKIIPVFTESTGIRVITQYDTTLGLSEKVSSGVVGDVLAGVSDSVERLINNGFLLEDPKIELVQTKTGIATFSDSQLIDISTVENLRQSLLNARSVCYSLNGASGIHFVEVLKRMNIFEAVQKKATIIESGYTALQLLNGKADIAVQQISELRSVRGIHLIGPLPDEVQKIMTFSASVFRDSTNPNEAKQFMQYLSSAYARNAYDEYGLIPLR